MTEIVKPDALESVDIGEGAPVLGDLVERDRVAPITGGEHPPIGFERADPGFL